MLLNHYMLQEMFGFFFLKDLSLSVFISHFQSGGNAVSAVFSAYESEQHDAHFGPAFGPHFGPVLHAFGLHHAAAAAQHVAAAGNQRNRTGRKCHRGQLDDRHNEASNAGIIGSNDPGQLHPAPGARIQWQLGGQRGGWR